MAQLSLFESSSVEMTTITTNDKPQRTRNRNSVKPRTRRSTYCEGQQSIEMFLLLLAEEAAEAAKIALIAATAQKLFEEHKDWVNRLLRCCYYSRFPVHMNSEVEQTGLLGLWKAAQNFEPDRNVQFKTYASKVIKNEFRKLYREVKDASKNISAEPFYRDSDNDKSNSDRFIVPEDQSPAHLGESREMIELLNQIADETPLVKERNGIKIIALRLQGVEESEIVKMLDVRERSVSALVSLGRRVLQNNPKFLKYISIITNCELKTNKITIGGKEYTISYADNAVYNYKKLSSDEYLDVLVGFLNIPGWFKPSVADMTKEQAVVIVDADRYTFIELKVKGREIKVHAIESTLSRKAIYGTPEEGPKIKRINASILGDKHVVSFIGNISNNTTDMDINTVLSNIAKYVSRDEVAEELLDNVRYGETTHLINPDTGLQFQFQFEQGYILVTRVRIFPGHEESEKAPADTAA